MGQLVSFWVDPIPAPLGLTALSVQSQSEKLCPVWLEGTGLVQHPTSWEGPSAGD